MRYKLSLGPEHCDHSGIIFLNGGYSKYERVDKEMLSFAKMLNPTCLGCSVLTNLMNSRDVSNAKLSTSGQ